jgi:hypothetical protein
LGLSHDPYQTDSDASLAGFFRVAGQQLRDFNVLLEKVGKTATATSESLGKFGTAMSNLSKTTEGFATAATATTAAATKMSSGFTAATKTATDLALALARPAWHRSFAKGRISRAGQRFKVKLPFWRRQNLTHSPLL